MTRILIADDSPQDTELTLAALGELHLAQDVTVVRDGVEALDYLQHCGDSVADANKKPLVVILDLKMPRMDGLQVLQELKRNPELRSIPVVMLTSSREESDVLNSYQLGVNAYVVKPVDFKEFVKAIQQIGVFWALINEPPPGSTYKTSTQHLPRR